MPSVSFHMGTPSHATGRRAFVTIPVTKMNLGNLTHCDRQVNRVRTLSHDIMYLLHAVGLWVTILYQYTAEERQLKCRNWLGFFLPLFTIMSDPRLAILREASAPILFVVWLILASEWHSASSDTSISMAHGNALDAVYAPRVGCYHGDSACRLLSWFIWTIFGISFCFFAELALIIYIHHRENSRDFFVGLFRRLLGRPAIPASASSSVAPATPVSEETVDLEAYDHYSVRSSEAPLAGAQTPATIDIFHFDWPCPPSHAPIIPHNESQLEGLALLCACTSISDVDLDQIEDDNALEVLPTGHSFPLQKEEGFFVVSAPACVNTPRPLTRSFTSVAQMLGLGKSGSGSRANTPYPHHAQYVPSESIVTKVFMVQSFKYDTDPFLPSVAVTAAVAVQTDGQDAVEVVTECIDQPTSFLQPQSVIASAVEEAAVEGAALSESDLSTSPLPQSDAAAVQGTTVEEAFQALPFSKPQGGESEEETLANDDKGNNSSDAFDDETEEIGYRYGQYDLDEYRKRLRERRLHAYRTVARTQMLELAKYASDPLPDCPQQ
ncbi:MAG: hypothetical protein JOS17DRAFT_512034 [Linnemannia elongata]|nr:MAG: hypothetical protein JOS17DRAFT_512034 [Linnemannia elongata]